MSGATRMLILTVFLLSGCGADVTLSWDEPTEYENGHTLMRENIAGYDIRYAINDEPHQEMVVDNATFSVDFLNTSPGTWVFQVRTVDINNRISDWSEEVSVTINFNGTKVIH